MPRRAWVCGWVALGLLCASPLAAAQDGVGQAKMLDMEGTGLFQSGQHRAALERFKAAYAALPNANSAWNIARCYEELAELHKAIEGFRLYLSEPGVSEEDKADAQSHIQALQERLQAAQAQAQEAERLEGDGQDADAQAAWLAAWRLNAAPESLLRAGLLQAKAPEGAAEARLTLEHVLALPELRPEQAARARQGIASLDQRRADARRGEEAPVLPPPVVREESAVLPAVGWTLLGLGAVGVGVGGYFALRYPGDKDAIDAASKTPGATDAYNAANADLNRDEIGMGVGFGLGGLALAGGITMLLLSEPDAPAATAWQLLIGPGQVGVGGAF